MTAQRSIIRHLWYHLRSNQAIQSERFCPNGFLFDYRSGIWLLVSHIILSQTCSKLRNESIEDSEEDNRLEKIDFVDLPTDWRQIKVNKHGLTGSLKMAASFFSDELFFRIAETSEADGKAECSLVIGEDKK